MSSSASSSASSAASSGSSSAAAGSSSSSAASSGSSSASAGSSSSSAASAGSSNPPAGSSSSSAASPGSSSAASSSSGGISSKAVAVTAASSVVGAILLILIAVLIIKIIRKNKMKDNSKPSTIEGATTPSGPLLTEDSSIKIFLEDISKENPMRFSPQQLKEITGNYTKELGRGAFGRVYEGKLKKFEMPVAVKVLQGSVNSVEAQFIAEVGTMYRTNHVNLVKLFGFCFDTEVKALVCEYMENGSLDHYLSGKKDPLEFEKLYEIAVGTARGIRYLHEECDKKIIIHYDIKPGNVLLSRNFSPKVGDFGLAELLDREATVPSNNQGKGTCGFAAPEVAFSFTRKSDVYSFGMLLFQILGSKKNIEGKRAENQLTPRRVWNNISKGGVASILSLCGIEDDNREKAKRMCSVALMCVRYQSETRPSMSSVLRMLEGKEEIGETVSPFNIWLPSHADQETEVSAGDYQPIESSSK